MNFNKRGGVRINGGSKFEKELKIIIKHGKSKSRLSFSQVVIAAANFRDIFLEVVCHKI